MAPGQCLLLLWGIIGFGGPALWWLGLSIGSLALPLHPLLDRRAHRRMRQSPPGAQGTGMSFPKAGRCCTRLCLALYSWPMAPCACWTRSYGHCSGCLISHKRMLEWVTAADSEKRFSGGMTEYIKKMLGSMILGAAAFIVSVLEQWSTLGGGAGVGCLDHRTHGCLRRRKTLL